MRSSRFLMTVVLLSCFLVAPVAAMDLVVCFGADGHVTLEPARNGRCGTSPWSSSAVVSQTKVNLSTAEHCGPCVDMPFLIGDAREQPLSVRIAAAPLDMPVLVPTLVTFPLALFPPPVLAASAPTVSLTLAALRTIILLI